LIELNCTQGIATTFIIVRTALGVDFSTGDEMSFKERLSRTIEFTRGSSSRNLESKTSKEHLEEDGMDHKNRTDKGLENRAGFVHR